MTDNIIDLDAYRARKPSPSVSRHTDILAKKNARTAIRQQVSLDLMNRTGDLERLFDFYNHFTEYMDELRELPAIDHSITTENLAKHMQHMSSLLNQCIIKINFAEKKLEKKSDHIQSVTDLIRIMTEIAVNLQNKKG
jgi:hypothetical protein